MKNLYIVFLAALAAGSWAYAMEKNENEGESTEQLSILEKKFYISGSESVPYPFGNISYDEAYTNFTGSVEKLSSSNCDVTSFIPVAWKFLETIGHPDREEGNASALIKQIKPIYTRLTSYDKQIVSKKLGNIDLGIIFTLWGKSKKIKSNSSTSSSLESPKPTRQVLDIMQDLKTIKITNNKAVNDHDASILNKKKVLHGIEQNIAALLVTLEKLREDQGNQQQLINNEEQEKKKLIWLTDTFVGNPMQVLLDKSAIDLESLKAALENAKKTKEFMRTTSEAEADLTKRTEALTAMMKAEQDISSLTEKIYAKEYEHKKLITKANATDFSWADVRRQWFGSKTE